MSYARIDEMKPHAPGLLELGGPGALVFAWYCAGYCYAERQRSDGRIPRAALGLLLPGCGRPPRKVLAGLEQLGWWTPLPDRSGWQITDYLVHNEPVAVRVEKGRKAALARWKDAQRTAPSSAPGTASGTPPRMLGGMPRPVLSRPDPERPESGLAPPLGNGPAGEPDLAAVAARERARRGLPASPELAAPTVAAVMRALGSSPEAPQP